MISSLAIPPSLTKTDLLSIEQCYLYSSLLGIDLMINQLWTFLFSDILHQHYFSYIAYLRHYQYSFADLIEEIISEYGDRPLPGPPAPPAELLCQPHGQNHRMLRQSTSPPAQPVLVARGTACQVSGFKNDSWVCSHSGRFLCQCSHLCCFGLIWFLSPLEVSCISQNDCWQHPEGMMANGAAAGLDKHR